MQQSKKLNWLITILLMVGISTQSFSQSLKDFFNDNGTKLTYLGIDYFKNKLINVPDANENDIKNRIYGSMNDVVLAEMDRNYKIGSAFSRSSGISTDISAVTARNEKIKPNDITSSSSSDFNRLTEADISAEVKALGIKSNDGIGLVFIMEGMKKDDKKGFGAVWVTLIDMKTKKVLMTERMEQEAQGFGFRNYWVSIIKKSIIEIDKKKYKAWKSQYGG